MRNPAFKPVEFDPWSKPNMMTPPELKFPCLPVIPTPTEQLLAEPRFPTPPLIKADDDGFLSGPLIDHIQEKKSSLDVQVGGSHYKDKGIQPVEYMHANDLDFFQGNVVKYVTRWRDKGGIADLQKARHYLDIYIELEEKRNSSL